VLFQSEYVYFYQAEKWSLIVHLQFKKNTYRYTHGRALM